MHTDALIHAIHLHANAIASNTTTSEQDLSDAVTLTVKDAQFRKELGASPEFWNALVVIVHAGASDDSRANTFLIAILKLARNASADHPAGQQLAIKYGALIEIEKLVHDCLQHAVDQRLTIVQIGTQAICNIITNNKDALDNTWKTWMGNSSGVGPWKQVLSLSDSVAIMSTQVLILNSIKGSANRCELLVSSQNGRAILGTMLDDMERLHNDEQSKSFELGYAVVSEVIAHGYFVQLYDAMEDPGMGTGINSRQTTLVKLLDSKIHTMSDVFPGFIQARELQFIARQALTLSEQAIKVIEDTLAGEADTSGLDVVNVSNIYTRLVLLFQITSTLLLVEDTRCLDLQQLLVEEEALRKAVDLLRHLEQLDPAGKRSSEEAQKLGFGYLKRETVKFIGTMCHKDKRMQDEIRGLEGIPLILNQCRIDDANPYIREYAIIALRNILEDNFENQSYIEELQPIEAAQHPELGELGLRTKLVDGKVRLEKSG